MAMVRERQITDCALRNISATDPLLLPSHGSTSHPSAASIGNSLLVKTTW